MHDEHKAELKKEKKIKRLLVKSAWAMGLGVGLLLLKFVIAPMIGSNEQTEKALGIFSWCLIAYGGAIILTFMFLRNFLFKVNILLSWTVMPLIFLKLLMDAF